ncbi:MAG: family 43 glycosylhydrolase [Muribaculaceae bacterium]|nr:family 43 glycosylhydrolase [Muribaculaceae bacterium]
MIKSSFVLSVFSLFSLTLSAARSFDAADPDVHDPVMAFENGRYYLFSTGMGINMLSSDDLMTWRQESSPLDSVPSWTTHPVPEYRGHTWAPDILRHDGKWYLYYSCSSFGKNSSAIGVTVNSTLDPSSPEYRWEDLGLVIHSVPGVTDWNAIDPNVIIADNGEPWMTLGSFWDGIQLVRLDSDMKTPIGNPVTIARRFRRTPAEAGHTANDNAIEAPFIIRHDGYYYLFASHDYCCRGLDSNYNTVVGRSRNITGPYTGPDGTDMAEGGGQLLIGPGERYSGVGHCSVYNFGDKWYFLAHGYDKSHNGASKLVIRNLRWDNGWPVIITDNIIGD